MEYKVGDIILVAMKVIDKDDNFTRLKYGSSVVDHKMFDGEEMNRLNVKMVASENSCVVGKGEINNILDQGVDK